MYIIKNAWKSIIRNKSRNFMIMIIALVIAIAACIALSIREAAETAKEDTLNDLSITAQLSFDRTSMMEEMRAEMQNDPPSEDNAAQNGGFDRGKFDFDSLQGSTLTLDDYMEYTKLQKDSDSYYYTLSASLNASGELLPYGEEESDDTTSETSGTSKESGFGEPVGMAGQNPRMGGMEMSSADFNLTGYSSYDAMLTTFGEDGTYTISDGTMFDEASDEAACIISDELAMYNNLEAGDTITLCNPDCEDETYELIVTGIYNNSASDEGNSRFARSDPANNIYMNSTALQAILDASAAAGNTMTDSDGSEVSAALEAESSFTYVFANAESYEAFAAAAEEKGLPENYTLSSPDLAAYENSITPLNTLSTMTGWFFLIVLVIGGIILVVINMFNLRERKYEVGVLTAIGMKKSRVAAQFIFELFLITFTAIIIGACVGAAVSVPVTNALLKQQIEKTEASNEQINNNFGMEPDKGGNMGQPGGNMKTDRMDAIRQPANYIESVTSATNLTVILQMILVGALLTILSSMAAMITIMRYEPLQILSNRS